MNTEEAIRIIQHAQDYPIETVKQAVREGLAGEHGEYMRQMLLAISTDYEDKA